MSKATSNATGKTKWSNIEGKTEETTELGDGRSIRCHRPRERPDLGGGLYCRARLLCQTPRTSCRQENQGRNRYNRNSNNNNTKLFVRLPPHTLEALVEDALMTAQTQPGTWDASSATRTGEGQGTAEAGIGFSGWSFASAVAQPLLMLSSSSRSSSCDSIRELIAAEKIEFLPLQITLATNTGEQGIDKSIDKSKRQNVDDNDDLHPFDNSLNRPTFYASYNGGLLQSNYNNTSFSSGESVFSSSVLFLLLFYRANCCRSDCFESTIIWVFSLSEFSLALQTVVYSPVLTW